MYKIKYGLLFFVIAFHFFVVIINLISFFILPFLEPLYVAVPCMSAIVMLSTLKTYVCPLTALENSIRESLSLPIVHGWMGHYLVRPMRRFLGIKKRKSHC